AYNPGAPSGSRIESISKSDGTPVDMTDTARTYRIAVNDYLAAGGDGFSVCKTVKFSDTHILLRDALAENIRQTGHITAKIEGRIKNVQNAGYITRAEFAGLLTRALDLAGDESAAGFSDVFPGQQFADVVGAAAKAGLVCGYEDGSFRPGYPVSREEMTVMAVRAVRAAGFTAEASNVNAAIARFYDQDEISGWARIPVAAAVEAGIVCGRESDYFDPSGHVTRAEAAAVLERALGYINR
ncbi:MAG TPA: S-layer homology domain-containing protein, partial [Bacillota bacterium]|nr:S-layer homology domain-containing protein [Bacillota bacterium]